MAGASSRQAVCGASRPAEVGRMSTVNSERRMVNTQATLHLPTRHIPLATRHSPLATRHSPLAGGVAGPSGSVGVAGEGACLFFPAACRLPHAACSSLPPWASPCSCSRLPPDADASRQGEQAGQSVTTSSSVLTASLTPDLGHSVGRLSRFTFVRVQPRTPWRHAPASRSVSRLGGLHKNRFAPAAARVA